MNKTQIRFVKLMISFMLAMVLCFSVALPVFAAEDPKEPISYGTPTESAEATITKMLRIADGTAAPKETFKFTVTPVEVNGITYDENIEDMMPVIGNIEIPFDGSETSDIVVEGVMYIPVESDNIFAGADWPHAGVYVYEIAEADDDDTDGMDYSPAVYEVVVYVANKEGSGVYVAGIAAHIKTNDDSNAGSTEGTKVDPTPGGSDGYDYSQLIFTNTYIKPVYEGDPTVKGDHRLNINKTVTGEYGNRTKYFEFEVIVDKPATVTSSMTYKAYVVEEGDSDFEVVTSTDNYDDLTEPDIPGGYEYISFEPGTPMMINLKHGQQLVFTNLHNGASYIATESAVADYIAKVDIIDGDIPSSKKNTNANTELSTASADGSITERVIGDKEDKASFTNEYKTVTPMGVSVDDLPYIMLIVMVIVGFAAYIVFKIRRSAKDTE